MKKCLILGLMVSLFGCTQQKEEGVKFSGNFEQLPSGGFVYVEEVTEKGLVPIDTLVVNESGDFVSYLNIEEPSFYRVNINDRQIVSLILTGAEEEVELNAHGDDPRGFSEISGSYDTEYKNQIDELVQGYQQEIQSFRQIQMQARASNDANAFQTAQMQMLDLAGRTEKELKRIIRDASPSLAAVYGLQMIDVNQNVEFVDSIAMQLQAEVPNNFQVSNLVTRISATKSLAVGKEAPEISLANPDGEVITLSSLRGNYVLVDFWAAWCGPCRRENPNVVRVYNEYSEQNFEILGVSLDRTRDKWLGAIEQDGLPWLHVSDLKYWRSQAAQDYQVSAIPATFLIDPDGIIIAKNLRGASLEAKLREIFG